MIRELKEELERLKKGGAAGGGGGGDNPVPPAPPIVYNPYSVDPATLVS